MTEYFQTVLRVRTYQLWLYGFGMMFVGMGGYFWVLALICWGIVMCSKRVD